MPTRESERAVGPGSRDRSLAEALESLLEFTGATAGWVGLQTTGGRLAFPARRGTIPDDWLALQRAEGRVWGFAVREGPTLLNDLRGLPALGVPVLDNLLSCPLGPSDTPRGHVVLANKPHGFTSHDAAVLQGVAHLMTKRLSRESELIPGSLLHRVVDRIDAGVLVVDGEGRLVFANATWLEWAGFALDEVIGRPAPFPFWVSHRELAGAGARPGGTSLGALPFRRRDNSLFWCRVEGLKEDVDSESLTVALLHRVTGTVPDERGAPTALPLRLENLPFGVLLANHSGRVLWANAAVAQLLPRDSPGGLLRERVDAASAAALERLMRDPSRTEAGRMGSLVLHDAGRSLTAFWLTVELLDGPCFLFALTDDTEGFPVMAGPGETRAAGPPAVDWLALLLIPGAEVSFWDERWERMTGLSGADLGGVRSDLVLDWLFPRQRDRNLVADWLHEPRRRGGQAILEVLSRTGGRPMLCTFLPVVRSGVDDRREHWLLLAGESELFAGPGTPSLGLVRQFARGLGVLLNHYLTIPVGLAELALDRTDLPGEIAGWFQQILDSCQRATRLLSALEDLAALNSGEVAPVSLAALVREFLDELPGARRQGYELKVDVRDADATVRINRRMLRTVLHHLLSNARDALAHSGRRQIEIRVSATDEAARCEIRDTGEGLPGDDWTLPLAPFFSTKGAFARDPAHAAQEAAGLGLTVSQHLLALHGGHLELRSAPGEGTTATVVLPRSPVAAVEQPGSTVTETLRHDGPAEAPGPHARPATSPKTPPV
jgi:signal transduction histidine kinase